MENLDEAPINQGAKFEISEFSEQLEENYSHIQPLQRINDKNWKIRLSGYQEISSILTSNDQSKLQEIKELKQIHKYIIEANPTALENSIIMIKNYINKDFEFELDLIVKNSLEKGRFLIQGINQLKTIEKRLLLFDMILDGFDKIKENSEKRQKFHDSLITQINSKLPKSSSTAIQLLVIVLQNFGVNFLDLLKPYFKVIKKMAESTSSDQRKESMNFYQHAYNFLGDSLLAFINDLKKQQLEELEKYFTSYKESGQVTHPLRLPIIENTSGPQKKIEAYDLSDSDDIFKIYDEKWAQTSAEIEKWQDRLQAIVNLTDAASVPKISATGNYLPGNFFILVLAMLKKILLMDGNINVQKQAMKAIANILKNLRKPFDKGAKQLFPIILEKLKDKKTIECAQNCLNNYHYSLQISQLSEHIILGLQDKNPTSKIEIMNWLQKMIEDNIEQKKRLNYLNEILSKLVKDSDKNVREKTSKLLNILQESKSQDISSTEILESKSNLSIPDVKDNFSKDQNKTNAQNQKQEKQPQITHFMTTDQAIQLLQDSNVDSKFIMQIQDEKLILKSIEIIQKDSFLPTILSKVDIFIFLFKEKYQKFLTNLALNKELMKIIQNISQSQQLSNLGFNNIQFILIHNLGDPKFTDSITIIIQFQLNYQLDSKFLFQTILTQIMSQNSKSGPKTYSEFSTIFTNILQVNPTIKLPFKEVDQLCTLLLQNKNVNIRNYGKNIVQSILDYQGNEKASQMKKSMDLMNKSSISSQAKNESSINLNQTMQTQQKSNVPKVQSKKKDEYSLNQSHNGSVKSSSKNTPVIKQDFIPKEILQDLDVQQFSLRQSIQIDPKAKKCDLNLIILKLEDKQVSNRQQGFNLLNEAFQQNFLPGNFIQLGKIEKLITIIIQRVQDQNKPLQKQVILFLPSFVEKHHKLFKQSQKLLVDNLIQALSDKQIKQQVISVIDQIAVQFGLEFILNCLIINLKNENVDMRTEILQYLKQNKQVLLNCDKKKLVDNILNVLTDKNSDVRNICEEIVIFLIQSIGEKDFNLVSRTKTKTFQEMFKGIIAKVASDQPYFNEKSPIDSTQVQTNPSESIESNQQSSSSEIKDWSEWQEEKKQRLKQIEKVSLEIQLQENELLQFNNFQQFNVYVTEQLQKNNINYILKFSDLILGQLRIFIQKIDSQIEFFQIFSLINKLLISIFNEKYSLQPIEIIWILEFVKQKTLKNIIYCSEVKNLIKILNKFQEKSQIYDFLQGLINLTENSYETILAYILQVFPHKFPNHFESLLRYYQQSNKIQNHNSLIKMWGIQFPQMLDDLANMDPNTQIRDIVEILYFIEDVASINTSLLSNYSNEILKSIINIQININKVKSQSFNLSQFQHYFDCIIHKMITLQLCTKNLQTDKIQKLIPLLSDQLFIRFIEVLSVQELQDLEFSEDRIVIKIKEKLMTVKNEDIVKKDEYQYNFDENLTKNSVECVKELSQNIDWHHNIKILYNLKKEKNQDYSEELQSHDQIFQCYFIAYMHQYEQGIIVNNLNKKQSIQTVAVQKIINIVNDTNNDDQNIPVSLKKEEKFIEQQDLKENQNNLETKIENTQAYDYKNEREFRISQEIYSLNQNFSDNINLFTDLLREQQTEAKIDEVVKKFSPSKLKIDDVQIQQYTEAKIDEVDKKYSPSKLKIDDFLENLSNNQDQLSDKKSRKTLKKMLQIHGPQEQFQPGQLEQQYYSFGKNESFTFQNNNVNKPELNLQDSQNEFVSPKFNNFQFAFPDCNQNNYNQSIDKNFFELQENQNEQIEDLQMNQQKPQKLLTIISENNTDLEYNDDQQNFQLKENNFLDLIYDKKSSEINDQNLEYQQINSIELLNFQSFDRNSAKKNIINSSSSQQNLNDSDKKNEFSNSLNYQNQKKHVFNNNKSLNESQHDLFKTNQFSQENNLDSLRDSQEQNLEKIDLNFLTFNARQSSIEVGTENFSNIDINYQQIVKKMTINDNFQSLKLSQEQSFFYQQNNFNTNAESNDNISPSKKQNINEIMYNIRQSFQQIHQDKEYIDQKLQNIQYIESKNPQQNDQKETDQDTEINENENKKEEPKQYQSIDNLIHYKNALMNDFTKNHISLQQEKQKCFEKIYSTLSREDNNESK